MKTNEVLKAAGVVLLTTVSFKAGKLWGYFEIARAIVKARNNGEIIFEVTEED